VRLTRHAKNRLRWIGRRHPGVTEQSLLEEISGSETIGYDDAGNRRARLVVRGTTLTVVIDESEGVLITMWVE
jgi:hypothetical protein